jgi:hypothetical protein
MKLEPIVNPHAKSGQGVQKKTKQEEKDELIEKTKKSTIDKYGVSFTLPSPLRLSIKFLTCLK